MKAIIDNHNKALLNSEETPSEVPAGELCNCRGGVSNCPVDGECRTPNVIYEAEVRAAEVDQDGAEHEVEVDGFDYRVYTGQAMQFKQRLNNHKWTFSDPTKVLNRKVKGTGEEVKISIEEQIEEKEGRSELAKYVWKLKKKGLKYKIKWSIKMKATIYRKGMRYCDLCLSEKTLIAIADNRSLNKRNEIHRKCTHMNKYKLAAIPIDPT